jgi:hypothetical protein
MLFDWVFVPPQYILQVAPKTERNDVASWWQRLLCEIRVSSV